MAARDLQRDAARRLMLQHWREDTGGTFKRWFLCEERLNNFRSIRRGLEVIVSEIEAGNFGNVYKDPLFFERVS